MGAVQLSLYAPQRAGDLPLNAYFYDYDPNGYLRPIKDRKPQTQWLGHATESKLATELRFRWSDITESPAGTDNTPRPFVLNVEAYSQPDSKAPHPHQQPVADRHVTNVARRLLRIVTIGDR